MIHLAFLVMVVFFYKFYQFQPIFPTEIVWTVPQMIANIALKKCFADVCRKLIADKTVINQFFCGHKGIGGTIAETDPDKKGSLTLNGRKAQMNGERKTLFSQFTGEGYLVQCRLSCTKIFDKIFLHFQCRLVGFSGR